MEATKCELDLAGKSSNLLIFLVYYKIKILYKKSVAKDLFRFHFRTFCSPKSKWYNLFWWRKITLNNAENPRTQNTATLPTTSAWSEPPLPKATSLRQIVLFPVVCSLYHSSVHQIVRSISLGSNEELRILWTLNKWPNKAKWHISYWVSVFWECSSIMTFVTEPSGHSGQLNLVE